jgi:transposase
VRWVLAQEIDFLEQDNMLTELVKKRGQLIMFLPKFNCELNWAELLWSILKVLRTV